LTKVADMVTVVIIGSQLRRLVPGFAPWWHRLEPESGHVGFEVDSGTGADFLRVLQFPLPILIPPAAPHVIIHHHLGLIQ
jgi:hypothetical protein